MCQTACGARRLRLVEWAWFISSDKMRKAAVGSAARRQRLDQSLLSLMPGIGPGRPATASAHRWPPSECKTPLPVCPGSGVDVNTLNISWARGSGTKDCRTTASAILFVSPWPSAPHPTSRFEAKLSWRITRHSGFAGDARSLRTPLRSIDR